MLFADGTQLEVDFIVFSTGIRPQDKLANQCGLATARRGGIAINDYCQTSDPDVYAIGECASWQERTFGLVAPGYKMAQVAADHLLGRENAFLGADMSAKLKLLGVDVGGIGDAMAVLKVHAATFIWMKAKKFTSVWWSVPITKPYWVPYWLAIPPITVICCNWR